MLYFFGLLFVLLFPMRLISVALALCMIFLIVAKSATARRLPVLNRKDLVFCLYAMFAVLASFGNNRELGYFVWLVLLPWSISLIFQNIEYTEHRVRWYFGGLAAAGVTIATVMLFQVEPGRFNFSLDHLLSVDRNRGFYFWGESRGGPNGAAAVSAAAIILILAYLKFERRARLWGYAILAIPLVYLIVAGGRNAWVGTGICLLLFLVYRRTANVRVRGMPLPRLLLLTLVVGAVSYGAVSQIRETHGDSLSRRITGLLDPTTDRTVQSRALYWAWAVEMAKERPLGWGFNAYYERYGRTPHNELLGQLVATGWIAAALYALLIAVLWIHILRMPKDDPLSDRVRFVGLSFLTVYTLLMITENVSRSTSQTLSPMFWVVMGISFGVNHQAQRRRAADPARPRRELPVRGVRARGIPGAVTR